MSKYNYNFTIITSGGCNAKCDFCTDPMNYKASPDYMRNMLNVLGGSLPEQFNQLSISGGEPTISPDFGRILLRVGRSRYFKKKVLTTNGTKLLDFIELIGENIHHVNVSRHGVGYEKNVKVFKNKQIISDENLKNACAGLSKYGVDVNLNWVYSEDDFLTKYDVLEYVEYAKGVGAAKVTFRHDQNTNSLDETSLEKCFSDYNVVESGGCPVCRSKTILVNGMYVTFKSSFAEPGNEVGELYELIYHPSGKLTTDWEGKNEFVFDDGKTMSQRNIDQAIAIKRHNKRIERDRLAGVGSGGCGSGGCGSGGCGR